MPHLPILVTQRLTLRPPLEVDLEAIARALDDYEVSRWLGTVPHPYALDDARHWFERMEQGAGDVRWVAHDARGLVGFVSLRRRDFGGARDAVVLGYWFARPVWGRGYATEAVRAAVAEHFGRSDEDIVAGAHEGNAASLAIQHRLGFETVGHDTEHSLARGKDVPVTVNRLARIEFERRFPQRIAA